MKKLLRIAVAVGMVLCLGVTAFATANISGDGNGVVKTPTAAVTDDGQTVTVKTAPSTQDLTPAQASTVIADVIKDIATELSLTPEVEQSVKAAEPTVAYLQDITVEIPAGASSVTLTFEIPGATANDLAVVLHYTGSVWEKVGEGFGASVKATFTSFSPVAVVLLKNVAATSSAPSTNPGASSPKTGEQPVVLAAVAVALLAGAVAVVALKKREEM